MIANCVLAFREFIRDVQIAHSPSLFVSRDRSDGHHIMHVRARFAFRTHGHIAQARVAECVLDVNLNNSARIAQGDSTRVRNSWQQFDGSRTHTCEQRR